MRRRASKVESRPQVLVWSIAAFGAGERNRCGGQYSLPAHSRHNCLSPSRIGLYGLFGCGNFGIDGMLHAMLLSLRQVRPHAELICICAEPEQVVREFGVRAIGIGFPSPSNALLRVLLAGLRKPGSFVRAIWHAWKLDALIVTGSGQLEDFVRRPFHIPLSLFAWCLAAKCAGTRIAFVSVGAGPIPHPISRWFLKSAAAMAEHRSYRDKPSKEFMESIGFDTRGEEVYPDLAFKLPVPPASREHGNNGSLTVGVGVMAYHGWLKRNTSAAVYAVYLEKLKDFVIWLRDQGHAVRVLTGDAIDKGAVDELVTKVAAERPDLVRDRLLADPASSLYELMRQVAETDVVVATRFHNLVYALKLGKPTMSIGYGDKHDALMTEMGLGRFCQNVERLKLDLLIEQFAHLISDRQRYEQSIQDANLAFQRHLYRQDSVLAMWLP